MSSQTLLGTTKMDRRQNTQVLEVQQNRPVRRNSQSSNQPNQFHEDEYRPQNNVAMNTNLDMSNETFFNDLRHDSFVQTIMRGDDLVIRGFTNRTHDSTAWNQSYKNPLSGGINIHGGKFNIQGGTNMSQIGGNGPNEFNVNRGGRTSAGSASGGRTSGGINIHGGKFNIHGGTNMSQIGDNGPNEFNVNRGGMTSGEINIHGGEFNIQGGTNMSQIGGNGPNEFYVNRGGRKSTGTVSGGSASGGRTSGGRTND